LDEATRPSLEHHSGNAEGDDEELRRGAVYRVAETLTGKTNKAVTNGRNEMKKLMLMVAMLAMMLAMAAPAFAQTVAIDEGNDVEFNAGAQNTTGEVGDINQSQYGEAEAEAEDDSAAAASVDQSQDVTISQSNEFGNGFFLWDWWGWWF
jgi:hypothetical protein